MLFNKTPNEPSIHGAAVALFHDRSRVARSSIMCFTIVAAELKIVKGAEHRYILSVGFSSRSITIILKLLKLLLLLH